jgi:hypothetical protein
MIPAAHGAPATGEYNGKGRTRYQQNREQAQQAAERRDVSEAGEIGSCLGFGEGA